MSEENFADGIDDVSRPLDCALLIATSQRGYSAASSMLPEIAVRYAELGEFERAIDLTDEIDDPSMRDQIAARIAVACADAGEFEFALDIADSIEEGSFQYEALQRIAVAYARAGFEAQAVEVAAKSSDESSVLISLVDVYTQADACETATQLAGRIAVPDSLAWALTKIVEKHIEAQRTDEYPALLQRAEQATRAIEDLQAKISALVRISLKWMQAGEHAEGSRVLQTALRELKQLPDDDYKAGLLIEVDDQFRKAVQSFDDGAKKILRDIAANIVNGE